MAVVAGCTKIPAKVSISRILIDAPSQFDSHNRARDLLRQELTGLLDADPTVQAVNVRRAEATHSLHIAVAPAPTANEKNEYTVTVELRPISSALSFMATSEPIQSESLANIVSAAFPAAWHMLLEQRKLREAGEPAMLAALDGRSRTLKLYAIDRLGEDRSKNASKALVSLLEIEKDPEMLLRIIGALVAIGDEAAVRPLIALTYRKDPSFVLQIIFAVSGIGGRDAAAFLVTLAGGHPNVAVQKGAKDALDEMNRRGNAKDSL